MKILVSNPTSIEINAFKKMVSESLIEVELIATWDTSIIDEDFLKLIKLENFVDYLYILNMPLALRFSEANFEHVSKFSDPEMLPLINIGLDMMDRTDFTISMNLQDRQQFFNYLLCFWYKKIDGLKIDFAFFNSAPHEVVDYALYVVLKKLKIEVRMLMEIYTFNRKYLTDGFLHDSEKFNFVNQEEINEIELSKSLDKFTKTHNQALYQGIKIGIKKQQISKIRYFLDLLKPLFFIPSLFRLLNRLKANLSPELNSSKFAVRAMYIAMSGLFQSLSIILRKLEFRSSRNFYQTLAEVPDFNASYIYFPLHYQPERSTNPLGGEFRDQLKAISSLSANIPNNWMIYVKEHPFQFFKRGFIGYLGRYRNYYSTLTSIPKVKLIKLDSDQFQLIDNSKAVATITGTAGFESLMRGKRSISFGASWYRYLSACIDLNDYLNFSLTHKLISEITSSVDNDLLVQELKEILSNSSCLIMTNTEAEFAELTWDSKKYSSEFYKFFKDKVLYSINKTD